MRALIIVALKWVWGLLEEAKLPKVKKPTPVKKPKKPAVLFRIKLIGASSLMHPVHSGDDTVCVNVTGAGEVSGAMLYDSNGLWPICKYSGLHAPDFLVSGDAMKFEVDELLLELHKHRKACLEKV